MNLDNLARIANEKLIKGIPKLGKLGVCLVGIFKNYFLFLKIKNTKNLFD